MCSGNYQAQICWDYCEEIYYAIKTKNVIGGPFRQYYAQNVFNGKYDCKKPFGKKKGKAIFYIY